MYVRLTNGLPQSKIFLVLIFPEIVRENITHGEKFEFFNHGCWQDKKMKAHCSSRQSAILVKLFCAFFSTKIYRYVLTELKCYQCCGSNVMSKINVAINVNVHTNSLMLPMSIQINDHGRFCCDFAKTLQGHHFVPFQWAYSNDRNYTSCWFK